MTTKTRSTVDDLYRVPENGKADIAEAQPALLDWTQPVDEILKEGASLKLGRK